MTEIPDEIVDTATAAMFDVAFTTPNIPAFARAALAAVLTPAAIAVLTGEAVAVPRVRKGIYVASRASIPERGAMWRASRAAGHPIISSWIDEDGVGATEDFGDLWDRIRREVTGATAIILYAEPEDFPLKGAYVEVGMALAASVPVYAVLPRVALEPRTMRPVGSWLAHPKCRVVNTIGEAFAIAASPWAPEETKP